MRCSEERIILNSNRSTSLDVKLVVTEDYETGLARLVSGDADAAALNYQAGATIATRPYPGKLTRADLYF
jgi:hypothetical protein